MSSLLAIWRVEPKLLITPLAWLRQALNKEEMGNYLTNIK